MPMLADIAALRTLALVGPAAGGKTSLVEALLWKAGAMGAPGSVERGTTVSDYDPLERRRSGRSTRRWCTSTMAASRTHLIDTPGAPDFLGQSLPALEAVETAAVVISATTGIEPMAVRMMQWARAARTRPADHRQQDRRAGREPAGAGGADPGRLRPRMPAA